MVPAGLEDAQHHEAAERQNAAATNLTVGARITIEQVHQILDACCLPRIATYFWIVYSLGLRLEEGLNLQVADIGSQRTMVHVHHG